MGIERGNKGLHSFDSAFTQYLPNICYPTNLLKLGEQVNFQATTSSEGTVYDQALSIPNYPPQVWSSFTSFASFSTSVMASMSSMAYYETTFGPSRLINTGVLFAISLVILLVFLELSYPLLGRTSIGRSRGIMILGALTERFSGLAVVLLAIFLGMVFTTLVLIVTS